MKYGYTKVHLGLLALLPLWLAACAGINLGQVIPTPLANPTPTELTGPSTTFSIGSPTPTPAPPATETPTLMCTPPACASGESYACPSGDCPGGCGTVCVSPTPITGPLAPAPTDWENLEGWLTTLWRSNVNPAAVRAALQQSGMQKSLSDWAAADFDGDLQDEWVLVLYDQSLPGTVFGSAGDLWVVNGDGVTFRYYTAPSNDIYEFLAPSVTGVADMTGDGLPEIITDAPVCGASTCTNNYRIVGLQDGQMVDLVNAPPTAGSEQPGHTISVTFADTRIEDIDADGLPELLAHGGTLGSAGAGIVRPRTEVWGWDGAAVTRTEILLDPSNYRHHILYEANDLMGSGDLARAVPLYEALINDDSLRDDGYAHPPEQVRADISAFAAFRLILIDRLIGDSERAASRLAWLQATYPDSAAASAADRLIREWGVYDNSVALCEQIESGLAALENPTGSLADMGYGNPSLGAADFCP
jgi:hypothetical protein